MSKHQSAGTPATRALNAANVAHTLHLYQHDPTAHSGRHQLGFGEEATVALGVAPHLLFKSLIVELAGGETPLVTAVVPVNAQLDLKALAGLVGAKKAALAEPALAEKITGYVAGGISPIGQKRQTHVIIDSSAQGLASMFVSAGRRGLQVELAPFDLASMVSARFGNIAR